MVDEKSVDVVGGPGSTIRMDLETCYQKHLNQRAEVSKHIQISTELNDMLGKGLFACAADMVFKVI